MQCDTLKQLDCHFSHSNTKIFFICVKLRETKRTQIGKKNRTEMGNILMSGNKATSPQ